MCSFLYTCCVLVVHVESSASSHSPFFQVQGLAINDEIDALLLILSIIFSLFFPKFARFESIL